MRSARCLSLGAALAVAAIATAGAGAAIGRSRLGVPTGRFAGVSGTSVERFADSAVPGGVAVGNVGDRLAIGLRPAHPEPINASKNKLVEPK